MKTARKEDRDKVVRIICESFDSNPHIDFIIKNDSKRNKRMQLMASYAFDLGMRRNGVYLTDDELGVAIIYKHGIKGFSFNEYLLQAGLALNAFGLSRTAMVNKLENKIKSKRASKPDFLYLWFFGVADEGRGSEDARELMKFIFSISKDQKLPIYLETSLKRNSIIYKRFGFETYDTLDTGYDNLQFWYMKRPYDVHF